VVVFGTVLIGEGPQPSRPRGQLWAAPLTWLLYGPVLGLLILTAIGTLVSLDLGTPRV
jgi:hypothetical protein